MTRPFALNHNPKDMPVLDRLPRTAARLRPLAISVVLVATAGIRTTSAQTVIVRSAPAGSAIELTMNGGTPVTATADSEGDATLAVPARASEDDVQMHVAVCGNLVRVLVVSRGLQPSAAAGGCTRTDFPSTFVMRAVTTFVVDILDQSATVHVTQGPPPPEWVHRGPALRTSKVPWATPSTGLALSAAAGFSTFSNQVAIECGTAPTCNNSNFGGAVALGADYWITRFAAAHIGYLKPSDVTTDGGGDGYQFDSRLTTRVLTIGGKAGASVGPVRLYGMGGLNRHEATTHRTETIGGATQVFDQKTTGWNWVLGGGAEAWMARFIAIYGELQRVKLKGEPTGGGEGGINDAATFILAGVRLRLGR
jgi:hypothetical protein